jgi:hypothetical protein
VGGEIREGKDDKNCTRITVGGNLIFYPGDADTNTASLVLIKLMLNSVISCKGARFSTIDINNFYFDTPMVNPKYVRIKITDIPEEFILEFDLAGKEDHNGWIYFEILRGCYGLPQAGILANNLLCGHLEKEGYYEAATTPGLWKHKWGPIQFCLIIDNFGVEYVGIEHFNHLLAVLQRYHQVQTNMAGNKIVGLNVQWDFPSKQVPIAMKSYFNNLLLSLNQPMPKKPQLLPFTATPIAYGQKTKYMPDEDSSAPLLPEPIKRMQKNIGSFLYYAQAVDKKLLVALNAISAQQAKATVHTEQLVEMLLN